MLDLNLEHFNSCIVVTGCLVYFFYYRRYYGQAPKFYAMPKGKFTKFLETHVKSIKAEYWPFYFMPSGRYQTILATLLPSTNVHFIRETLVTVDGGQFSLAWANQKGSVDTKELLFISPGLVSKTNTNYVQQLIHEMSKKGYQCVMIVNRGLELPLLTPKAYCATHTVDIDLAAIYVRKTCPNASILGVGISLGGVILSHYLSKRGKNSDFLAAFVCSSPFNTVATSASLEQWDNWLLYGFHVTQNLKYFYMKSKDKFEGLVDHNAVMSATSVREFDKAFTARTFGYETVDQYYEDAMMTDNKILSIQTPTLYLYADDDAFVPVDSIPDEIMSKNEFIASVVTQGGGHVAHLQGLNPLQPPYYLTTLADYAKAVFTNQDQLRSF